MKTFKTAVIGCGMISKNHFKALKNVENADCVVACDIRPERAAAAAEAYDIPHTETEYHKVLDNPEIDVVHICLPHYLHAQVAIEAMEHGKHVLCEKPMALDPADAEKMIEVRDRTGRTLGICFQNRYNDSSRYMRSLMDSGRMGKVLGARGAVFWNRNPEYYTESDWRGTLDKEGGSALENQAIHTFDLMQWLTVPIKTVEASCSTKRHKGVIETEDTCDVFMTGPNGERFVFFCTNCYVKNAPVELEIVCENGSIRMVVNLVTTELDGKTETKDFSSGTVFGKDYWGSGHGFLIEDYYTKLAAGERFPVSGEEAIVSTRLLHAVYSSAKNHEVIRLDTKENQA